VCVFWGSIPRNHNNDSNNNKTTMSYYNTPTRLAKIKKPKSIMGKLPSSIAAGGEKLHIHWEKKDCTISYNNQHIPTNQTGHSSCVYSTHKRNKSIGPQKVLQIDLCL
jgi:hypothetical protein